MDWRRGRTETGADKTPGTAPIRGRRSRRGHPEKAGDCTDTKRSITRREETPQLTGKASVDQEQLSTSE